MTMRGHWRGYAKVAGAAATWGTWSLFLKPAERLGHVSPALEAFFIFAACTLLLMPRAIRARSPAARTPRGWAVMLLLGTADSFNALCFFWAMQRTSLAIAVLSHYLAPVFIAAAAPWVLRERARVATWICIAVALVGLVLLLEPWRSLSDSVFMGASLGALSAVFYAMNVLTTKRLHTWFSPTEFIAFHAAPAAVIVALFVPHGGWAIGFPSAIILAAGALVPGTLAGVVFLEGLFAIPASHASILTLLEPLVAVLLGVAVWNEPLSLTGWAGASLILMGAYGVMRSETK